VRGAADRDIEAADAAISPAEPIEEYRGMHRLSMFAEVPSRPLANRALVTLLTAIVLVACSHTPPAQDNNQTDWVKYYKHIDEPQQDN